MKPNGGATTSVFNINVKPIIAELARTEVCFPNIQLLVDKIIVQPLPDHGDAGEPKGAFRLWLTDGECTIQALVKRRLYKRLVIGDIREGSYVLLKEYTLERADKLYDEGEVIYLALKNFYAIGEDEREKPDTPDYLTPVYEEMGIEQSKIDSQSQTETLEHIFPLEITEPAPRPRLVDERPTRRSSAVASSKDIPKSSLNLENLDFDKPTEAAKSPSCSPSNQLQTKKRKLEIALGEIDPNLSSPPKKVIKSADTRTKNQALSTTKKNSSQECRINSFQDAPPPKNPKPAIRPQIKRPYTNATSSKTPQPLPPTIPSPSKAATSAKPPHPHPPPAPAPPRALLPITRPLHLIPLSKMENYPLRNRIYDVFVVIHSVSPHILPRPTMPSGQRDCRIVDPSTSKKVALSVFVDPENFAPEPGTVALIRNVTTHEWDGGSLKVWPARCAGREWFVRDPVGVGGCDVGMMRAWWRGVYGGEGGKVEEVGDGDKEREGM